MTFSEGRNSFYQPDIVSSTLEIDLTTLLLGPRQVIIPGIKPIDVSASWETQNKEGFPIFFICYRINNQAQSWLIRYKVIVTPDFPQGQYILGSGATTIDNQAPEWWEPDWNHTQALNYGQKTVSELISP